MPKMIDLSVPLMQGIASDPPAQLPQIKYTDHKAGARIMEKLFPGVDGNEFPGGMGWAVEDMYVTSHAGTHMDAPYHYSAVDENGQPMQTIDEIPLEWCFGPGVKLDFSGFEDGYLVTPEDVEKELKRINHTIAAGDIVLIQTKATGHYGKPDYLQKGCGMSADATVYLTSRGVKVVGTDAWSWDIPFDQMRKNFERTGDVSAIWQGHFAGRKYPYYQMEKLGNLDKLPATGFKVIAVPVNIYKASAGWTRPVAIIEEG